MFVIAVMVIVVGLGVVLLLQQKERRQEDSLPFEKRRYLCNKDERNFFRYLVRSVSRDYLVLTKVRLADLMVVDASLTDRKKIEAYEKIASRKADFVLVDRATTEIRVVIELFNGRINNAKRVQQGLFIDRLFDEVRIPLLRIRLSENYHINDLKRAIWDAENMYQAVSQETLVYQDVGERQNASAQRSALQRQSRSRPASLAERQSSRALNAPESNSMDRLSDRAMEKLPANTVGERPSRIKVA